MDIMEVILLVAGGVIFTLSFLIPERKSQAAGGTGELAREEIKNLVSQELEAVRSHVDDVVEEAVTYAMEKTERSLERLSNEKIMAVNEYSETVLAEIHKNHEEAVFLYDMLNNKHVSLKNAVSEVYQAVKEAEEKASALQRLAPAPEIQEEKGVWETELPVEEPGTGVDWERETVSEAGQEAAAPEDEEAVRTAGEQQFNHNEEIIQLYREGKSVMDIARELGLGMGEVRLVIDLSHITK